MGLWDYGNLEQRNFKTMELRVIELLDNGTLGQGFQGLKDLSRVFKGFQGFPWDLKGF
jgi:hypothetical protein